MANRNQPQATRETRAHIHDAWHPSVIDPTNPIQPDDYPSMDEYLMAVNLANFIGAVMNARQSSRRLSDRRPIRRENSYDNPLERKS
jgi:hypothetical protein